MLRRLVRCPICRRQFDAGTASAGERFRCACGTVVVVPDARPHDADVVRCSACGAARAAGESACRFCGAEFTLVDRDLNTLCSSCGARVGDRARFCHHCGTPIVPETLLAAAGAHACPSCGTASSLRGRRIAGVDAGLLECPRCAGLWTGHEVFALLATGAERQAAAPWVGGGSHAAPSVSPANALTAYRPCPICGKLMLRRNYGGGSGVVIDACARHGLWFDAIELERILDWIRAGGLEAARRREIEEARELRRASRTGRPPAPPLFDATPEPAASGWEFVGRLVDWVLERLANWRER